ncbi:MAG: RNA-binding S4 domain-containing protein [Pseudomonadota bacterium]
MRIDKLLWFLRLAPSRTLAHDWVAEGHFRLNGRRIEKPSVAVGVGDVLTVPARSGVRVIELVAVPARRGPPPEAIACYRTLDERAANPIAAGNNNTP